MLEFDEGTLMLLVRILFIDTSLSKLVDRFTELSIRLGTSEV
jgi:hypothetical protein